MVTRKASFFNGYYGHYCYLPLYVFCGEHLLAAKLRLANIDGAAGAFEEVERILAQIRAEEHGAQALYEKLYCARRYGTSDKR